MKALVRNLLVISALIFGLSSLYSCSKDGEYSLGKFAVGVATVVNEPGTNWYLKLDSGEKLWIAAGHPMYNYQAIDGQRVIIDYTPLSGPSDGFDHMIKLNRIWNIETKAVKEIFDEGELGDAGNNRCPIVAEGFPSGIWVSGENEYLNVVVAIYSSKYKVSLIDNTLMEYPDDGYKYLELRYNAYDSELDYALAKPYSFVLKGLDFQGKKGLKIKRINVDGKEELMTYDFDEKNHFSLGSQDSDLNTGGESVAGEVLR